MTDLKKMKSPNFRIPKCLHNDCGYCKFGEKCRKRHYKNICVKPNCNRNCEGRHPKQCKFESKCRFLKKGICAFKHVALAFDDEEKNALKSRLTHLETENKTLKAKLLQLEEDLHREKANTKLATDALVLKSKESEEELKSQKINNDRISENLELKDKTVKNQNLKIFDLEKKKVESEEKINETKREKSNLEQTIEHFKNEVKSKNFEYAKERAKLTDIIEAKTIEAKKIENTHTILKDLYEDQHTKYFNLLKAKEALEKDIQNKER